MCHVEDKLWCSVVVMWKIYGGEGREDEREIKAKLRYLSSKSEKKLILLTPKNHLSRPDPQKW